MNERLIVTDMQLFGFPVYFDWRADRNIVELRNPDGQCIRIEIQPEPQDAPERQE